MARYVPKTYNNKRWLRIIVTAVTTIALSIVILFLILFFVFQSYVVDGQLYIPWLVEEGEDSPPPQDADEDEEDGEDGDDPTGSYAYDELPDDPFDDQYNYLPDDPFDDHFNYPVDDMYDNPTDDLEDELVQ